MNINVRNQRSFMLRWANMIDRCDNPENKMYSRYGGRGISVCPEWRDFYRYISDLPDDYFPRAELDRIDNDGDYTPSNVRWATRKDNSLNRSTTRMIEFSGKTMCVSHWADHLGINIASLAERLDKWSVEDALTMPKGSRLYNRWDGHSKPPAKPKKRMKLYRYEDKEYTMGELSRISGLEPKLLRKRINERMWDVARAVNTPLS